MLLISRTESKLKDIAKEIKAKYPARDVKTLALDYSDGFDAAKREKVRRALAGLEVGVLANNVGMSYGFTKYYHELTEQETADLVALNTESTLFMTKLVLDGMVARRSGAVVNTSSAAGVQISPLLAGYSAAKGGIVAFSKSLHYELKPLGIDVQVQTPLWVATKLAKIRKTSLGVPSPEKWQAARRARRAPPRRAS